MRSVVATGTSSPPTSRFHALARTEKAQYTEREVQGLSLERRRRYLRPTPSGYEIAPFSDATFASHTTISRTLTPSRSCLSQPSCSVATS